MVEGVDGAAHLGQGREVEAGLKVDERAVRVDRHLLAERGAEPRGEQAIAHGAHGVRLPGAVREHALIVAKEAPADLLPALAVGRRAHASARRVGRLVVRAELELARHLDGAERGAVPLGAAVVHYADVCGRVEQRLPAVAGGALIDNDAQPRGQDCSAGAAGPGLVDELVMTRVVIVVPPPRRADA